MDIFVTFLAIHQHVARRGLDGAVEHPNQGGLAGARKSHDHEDFSAVDGEAGVPDAHGQSRLLVNLLLVEPFLHELQRPFGVGAENLEKVLCLHAFPSRARLHSSVTKIGSMPAS